MYRPSVGIDVVKREEEGAGRRLEASAPEVDVGRFLARRADRWSSARRFKLRAPRPSASHACWVSLRDAATWDIRPVLSFASSTVF